MFKCNYGILVLLLAAALVQGKLHKSASLGQVNNIDAQEQTGLEKDLEEKEFLDIVVEGKHSRFLDEDSDEDATEGGCSCTDARPCSECERCDCDKNSHCQGSLVCHQRDAGDPIPGCPHIGTGGRTDFCAPGPAPSPPVTVAPHTHPSPAPAPVTVAPHTHPAPAPAPSPDGGIFGDICFSGDTTVQAWSKGMVLMKDLQVGDRILTAQNKYEEVYAFAHYHPSQVAHFFVLHINNGESQLEVSGEHLIYLKGKTHPVRARTIQTGDQLQTSPPATVTKIRDVTKTGVYAPLTPSGTLLVNGKFKASSYAALVQDTDSEYAEFQDGTPFISQHNGIHMVLAPFRLACRTVLAMGISIPSSDINNNNNGFCESYKENGLPPYVDGGIQILHWANHQPTLVQVLLFLLAFPLFGMIMVVESLLFGGATSLLLVVLGLLVGVAIGKFVPERNGGKTKTA